MKKFLFSVMTLFVAVTMSFAQTTTPYTEGFEEYDSGLPTGWEKVGSGTVEVQASTVHTGTKSLKFSGATSNVVALPAFDVEINTLQVTLYSRPEGNYTQCGSFDVGYVTDVTDASTFVAVSTWSYNESPSAYLEKNVMLNSAPAGARLAFRHRPTATYYYWFVDDVVVEALPSCYRPDQLATSEILSTGATINWVAGNGETQFQYVVMPKDVAADWTNATTVNATTATITGLESNTAYDFYVRAICSESEMSTANVLSFRTNCSAQAIPYTNDFESETSSAVPSCWTRPDGQSYPYVNNSTYSSYEGSKCLYFYGGSSTSEQFIVLPQFANAINTLAIKFYYKASVYSTYGVPQIGYVTNRDDMTTFVALDTLDQQSDYTLYELNLDAAPANAAYIAIRYGDGSSSGSFYVDNLTVKAIPTCRKPVSLVATPASTSSATITWAAGNNETTFEYVYALAGVDADWTNPTSVTALTATVTGLEQDSDYVFYVRANCGNEEISEVNRIDFHAQRYCTPAPTKVDGSGITAVALGGVDQTEAVHKTNSTAPLYADNSALTFEVAASTVATVDITYATSTYDYGTIIWVDWNNDMTFAADEVVYTGKSATTSPNTLNCTFAVPATQAVGTYRMRIGGADSYFDTFIGGGAYNAEYPCSTGDYRVYEDYSIMVTDAPSCTQPATFTYDSVTAYGAKLTWTAGLTETQFQYVAVPHGTDVNWTSATLVTGLTTTINTLTPETAYDVYLRASCGETELSDSIMLTFTTIPSCIQPTLPVVSDETVSGATFTWQAGNGETQFQYVVMPKDTTVDWTAAQLVEDTTVTVTGLNANKAYDFYVRAYCAADDQSVYRKVQFRTACGIQGIPYVEGFEEMTKGSNTSAAPSCWAMLNANEGNYPYIYVNNSSTYVKTGSQSLYFVSSSSILSYAILPEINAPLNTLRIRFSHCEESATSSGLLDLGYMTDITDAATFVSIAQYTRATKTWQDEETSLATIPAEVASTARLAFRYGGASSNYFMGVDDIIVDEIPNCLKPTGLTVIDSTITTTSATLTCTAGASETSWYVSYKAAADEDWTIVSGAVDTPYVLNGLNANTAYQVRMAAACGNDTSEWTSPVSFRTACGTESLPYADGFENGIYCWTVGNAQSTTSSYIPSLGTTYKRTGEKGLHIQAYKYGTTTNADSSYAILPAMDYGTPGLTGYTLKFYARSSSATTSSYNYYQHILVGVVTNPNDISTFELVQDVEVTTAYEDVPYEVILGSYAGTGTRLALLAITDPTVTSGTRYGHIYVDDIAIVRTPTCQPLAKIEATNVGRRNITVTLTPKAGLELASTYELVYDTIALDNDSLAVVDKTMVIDTNKFEITGLDRETTYYIYVRANCGTEDGVSAWVNTTVTTKGLVGCDDYTVGTGSSVTNSTIVTKSGDKYGYGQTLYLASEINNAGTINSIAYNLQAVSASYTPNWIVYMGHTSATSLTQWVALEDLTQVATITTPFEVGWNTIELTTPFEYNGTDNLVVAVANQTGSYTNASGNKFYYTSSTGKFYYRGNDYNAEYGNPSNTDLAGTASGYRAHIRFSFCYNLDPCPTVTDLNVDLPGDGTTEAHITWTAADADYLSAYEVVRSLTPIADFSEVTRDTLAPNQDSIVYTDLTAETKYYVYVRAICQAEEHSEGSSVWDSINFTTKANCPALQNLALALTATNAFQASWDLGAQTQSSTFRYILSTDTLDEAGIAAAEPVMVYKTDTVLSNLLNDQMYYFYVASACGDATSDYIVDSIKTPVACQAVQNLTAARVEHNRALITWNKAPFATETSWKIGFVGDEENAIVVDTTMHMFIGLTPETAYNVYVKALCGEDSESVVATVAFTTEGQPRECITVGTGTSSANLVYTSWGNTYSQQIYTADELIELGYTAGTITAISFDYSGISSTYDKTQSIYMGTTENTSFAGYTADDFIGDLTLVYEPTLLTYQSGWREYVLTTPFVWDGTSNIVVGMLTNSTQSSASGWSTRGTSTSPEYRSIYRYRDNTPIDINNLASVNSGGRSYTRPNIQFCFPSTNACPDVTALAINDITPTTAIATWEPMGQETSWNIAYATEAVEDPASLITFTPVNAMTYPLSGLEVDQDYWFYVQPVCTGADSWSVATFRTVATCFPPTALVADSIEARSALVCWRDTINATGNYTVAYGPAAEFDEGNFSTVNVQGDTCVRLTNLIPETNYKFKVRANCDDGRSSRYSTAASFRTAISCYAPTALVASDITISTAVITWTDLHDAAAYRVYYGEAATFDLEDEETYSYMDVENDTTATLTELNDSTNYKVMVKSVCGENDESAFSADITFRTANTYPYFMPAFTAVPSDWKVYTGLFNADTVRTANLTTASFPSWKYAEKDAVIDTCHVKLNFYGASCKSWFVSPAIDMTGADATAELVFDAALCDFGDPGTAIESTTNVGDDKFAVIISRDGGLTWTKFNRTLWAETADADYQYTSVPATGQRYTISLAQYAGEIIRVAFYGESTVSGGDNDFHIGNISLRNTVSYTEEICQYATEEEGFDNHGFEEASTDSVGTFHFERINETTGAYETFDLTVHELIYDFNEFDYAYVGDYFELPYIHFTVEEGVTEYSIEEQTVYGCDSVWEVYFEEIRTAEIFPTEYDVLAEGDTINWRGHKITVVGDYADTVRTVHGGVMEIHSLTVSESIPMTTYRDTVCQYDEFDNHGFEEASSDSAGTFHFEGDNIEFYLTVNPFTVEEYDRYLYPGDHYSDANFEEFVATIDTSYILVGTNVKGCDSIILMHVIINTVDTIRETFEMPENDTIWHGITITEPGMYYYTEPSFLGGDSIRYILTVTAPVTPVEGRTFELVTEQLSDWSGNYLIVFSDNKAHATVSGGNKKDLVATSGELTITSDNKITTADSCFVTLTAMGNDGYSILLPNGNYLNRANNSCAQSETAEAMTIGYTANGIKISGDVSGSTYYLYCNANNGSPVYRFYVDKTGQAAYALPRLFKEVSGEGPATAIETINTANEAVKVILNGNLYIIRDNQWYDATGRLTSDPRK